LAALRNAGIAYRAVEIETLQQRPAIQDVLALTRALLHPADRIAWLAVLRAPWCGLTLADLHMLVGAAPYAVIWERLQMFAELPLSAAGKKRLQHVVAVLSQSLQQRRRLPLANWIEGAWQSLGGPACVGAQAELSDVRAYFNLLAALEVGGDILNIAQLENKLSSLYSAADASARVEVMTIHKAKGLEFDSVILPGLQRSLPADDAQLLLALERPTAHGAVDLLLAPIKASADERDAIYDYLSSEEKKRADYEMTRLLYVAATRAKSALHLCAGLTIRADQPGEAKPAKNSFLAKLWPALAPDFLQRFQAQGKQSLSAAAVIDSAEQSAALRRLTADWRLPAMASGAAPEFTVEKTSAGRAKIKRWNNNPARHVGTVVHLLLQQICIDGIERWNEKVIAARAVYIRHLLAQAGVSHMELDEMTELALRALQLSISDPRGRWILNNAHQASAVEYPLTALLDGELVQGIIDRTFIDEQNVRWIIDYKTAAKQDKTRDEFITQEAARYYGQLQQYARIMALADPRPIKLGLYFPLAPAWHEWEFDGAKYC
jgi:ATP-dependent exoDNAse (exonuclease V) beta subunit